MRARTMVRAWAAAGFVWGASASGQDLQLFTAGSGAVGAVPAGNVLSRVWLPATPAITCNDGSTPAMYVRRAQNAADANNWVIYLQGGGNCGGGAACLSRWTSVGSNFGIQQMSTSVPAATWAAWHPAAPPPQGWTNQGAFHRIPPQMAGPGIFSPVNSPFGGWNRVFAYYCSSDNWTGQKRDSVLELDPPVGGLASYKVHFQGADIFDEIVRRLRAGGITYCQGGQCETLPTLDDADLVLLAGSSAGGEGVKHNLDRFRATMAAANPEAVVRGVIDAGGLPPTAALPWPAATSHVQYIGDRWTNEYQGAWSARVDDSCLAQNPPATQFLCAEPSHTLRHHITTPFFLRLDLQDLNALEPYQELFYPAPPYPAALAEARFAADATDHLQAINAFATQLLPRYPAELAAVAADPQWLPPGIFGPRCTNHVGLIGPVTFFQQQLPGPGGGAASFADALLYWVNTAPTGIGGAPSIPFLAPAGVGPLPPPACP